MTAVILLFLTPMMVSSSASLHFTTGARLSASKYWRNTGLKIETLQKVLTNDNCASSEQRFSACTHAINTLSGLTNPKTVIINPTQPFDFEKSLSTLLKSILTSDNEQEVTGAGYNAYLSVAYDPHTRIVPEDEIDRELAERETKFFGTGISLREQKGKLIVTDVLDESPAEAAGVKINDVVLRIGNHSAKSLAPDEAVKLLRDPKNQNGVKIVLKRKRKLLVFRLTPSKITILNTKARVITRGKSVIGYLRLRTFTQTSCSEVRDKLIELQAYGAKSIIFDLRNNPGGLITEAVCIASLFLGKDRLVTKIVSIKSEKGTELKSKDDQITNLPMVTLINARTASSSEIVAGALQDYQRSWIIGARSYGKGTSQEIGEARNGIRMIRTTHRFYLPSGRTNQIRGITPDLEIDDNISASREADEYLVPPIAPGPEWQQTRTHDVEILRKCLKQQLQNDTPITSIAEQIISCSPAIEY